MSRTEKVHTHRCPCVRYIDASCQAKAKAVRSAAKNEIRKMQDPDDLDFFLENSRRGRLGRTYSAGYLDPTVSEADYLKKVLSVKQSVANGTVPWDTCLFASNAFHKDVLNRVKQKDPTFKGDRNQAMLLLSNEELAECVHRFYASKGLKGRKR
ncbi:hypothetical protein [Fibrobacter sp. UWB11]|uniref:hypothetical protein n=1 Tax=Fibrobacter sp. UWB11 TaxID=1896202 RepID=UPI00092AA757|nr:hypothetical protein [Fibrobacter sp. UWB11]SIN91304.1 hypothetical protein SAMN05720758_0548 [Fibrobacter sp. UWB11]